jgi:mannose-6-phosphate isomerase
LNWIDIHPGEMIYVAGGTVHAIAPGSILVETQQSSDTTYRLYDYGRPRPLHLEQGMQAVKEHTGSGKVKGAGTNGGGKEHQELIASPYFMVEKFVIKEARVFNTVEESRRLVEIVVATKGCGVLETNAAPPVTFAPGEAVVVPACVGEFRVRPQWSVEFLRVRVPAKARPEPAVV